MIALTTRQETPHFNYTRSLSPVKPASQRNEGAGQCLNITPKRNEGMQGHPIKCPRALWLAPVLYGDPVCVLLSARMRERTFAYVTEKSESNAIVPAQRRGTRSGANVRIFATRRHSRRHKLKHPAKSCGVLLMMPCGCVVEVRGVVRSAATE